jgi:hypothetical protein
VSVPWARPGSGFTLFVRGAGAALRWGDADGEGRGDDRGHDTRIWRVVEHHVLAARDQLDGSGVCRVGMDETSARKGQETSASSLIWRPGGWSLPVGLENSFPVLTWAVRSI